MKHYEKSGLSYLFLKDEKNHHKHIFKGQKSRRKGRTKTKLEVNQFTQHYIQSYTTQSTVKIQGRTD